MKDVFESPKTFQAYGIIDLCYLSLNKIYKELNNPRSPLEKMIDHATGSGQANVELKRKEIVSLLEEIIKNKKIIDADYSNDEKVLIQLKLKQ